MGLEDYQKILYSFLAIAPSVLPNFNPKLEMTKSTKPLLIPVTGTWKSNPVTVFVIEIPASFKSFIV
jgi:hypothetical protein